MWSYFDTSAIVPLLIDEGSTDRCVRLWDEASRIVGARLLAHDRDVGEMPEQVFSYYDERLWRSIARHQHGVGDDDVLHAVEHEVVSVDLDPDADPPKVLVIGPDSAGNLLEVIVLVLADDRMIAIRAMKLRRHFYEPLPGEEGSS